jgi:hypothetical protein
VSCLWQRSTRRIQQAQFWALEPRLMRGKALVVSAGLFATDDTHMESCFYSIKSRSCTAGSSLVTKSSIARFALASPSTTGFDCIRRWSISRRLTMSMRRRSYAPCQRKRVKILDPFGNEYTQYTLSAVMDWALTGKSRLHGDVGTPGTIGKRRHARSQCMACANSCVASRRPLAANFTSSKLNRSPSSCSFPTDNPPSS